MALPFTPTERAADELHQERWGQLGFAGLLPFEKGHVGVFWVIGEVMNGGFDQFFGNSSGDLATYALSGLEAAGATDTHAILTEAMSLIPNGWCEDRSERCRRMADVSEHLFDAVTDRLVDFPEDAERMSLQLLVREYRALGLLSATVEP